eukprot:NODE_11_length_4253_cov_59.246001_g10_i0.p1 GENE.NODE_11_length_4253_cov_59.246001_g10_i0~~NODE_11_length_4253_cov_59.246001_g10_i0.p1  ORF type:complete len:1408 (-),score=386.10 NODE_11_length_4253_cov_59.246001_g10_i0:28-3651(-)
MVRCVSAVEMSVVCGIVTRSDGDDRFFIADGEKVVELADLSHVNLAHAKTGPVWNSLQPLQGSLHMLGWKSGWEVHLMSWKARLDAYQQQDLNEALALAKAYHNRTSAIAVGVPEEPSQRHAATYEALAAVLRAVMADGLAKVAQQEAERAAELAALKSKSGRKSVRFSVHQSKFLVNLYVPLCNQLMDHCVEASEPKLMFDVVFPEFEAQGQRDTFIQLLESRILSEAVTSVPVNVVDAIVRHYTSDNYDVLANKDKDGQPIDPRDKLEAILKQLDMPDEELMDCISTHCREQGLFRALVRIRTNYQAECVAPLKELFDVLVAKGPAKQQAGDTLMEYLTGIMEGCLFTNGWEIPYPTSEMKNEVVKFVFEREGNSHPHLRPLMDHDTEAFFSLLSIIFADSSDSAVWREGATPPVEKEAVVKLLFACLIPQLQDVWVKPPPPPANSWPTAEQQMQARLFFVHHIAIRNVPAKDKLGLLVACPLMHGVGEKDFAERARRQKHLVPMFELFQDSHHIDWENLLILADNNGFTSVTVWLHQRAKRHSKVIEAYLKDNDPAVYSQVFEYIRSVITAELKVAEDGKASILHTMKAAMKDNLEMLAVRDAQGLASIIMQFYEKEHVDMLSILNQYPEAQWQYLRGMLEFAEGLKHDGTQAQAAQSADEKAKLIQMARDHTVQIRYIELLCKFAREDVYPYLLKHDAYDVTQASVLCRKHDLAEGAAYLRVMDNEPGEALDIMLRHMTPFRENLMAKYKTEVEKWISASGVPADALKSSEGEVVKVKRRHGTAALQPQQQLAHLARASLSGTQTSDSSTGSVSSVDDLECAVNETIETCDEYATVRSSLTTVLSLASRSSDRGRSTKGGNDEDKIWFRLLDFFVMPKKENHNRGKELSRMLEEKLRREGRAVGPLNPDEITPEETTLFVEMYSCCGITEVFSSFIAPIMTTMLKSVELTTILNKIVEEHQSEPFGQFRGALNGILDQYSYQRSMYKAVRGLMLSDNCQLERDLIEGTNAGLSPQPMMCSTCERPLASGDGTQETNVFNCGHAFHTACWLYSSCKLCEPPDRKSRRDEERTRTEKAGEKQMAKDPQSFVSLRRNFEQVSARLNAGGANKKTLFDNIGGDQRPDFNFRRYKRKLVLQPDRAVPDDFDLDALADLEYAPGDFQDEAVFADVDLDNFMNVYANGNFDELPPQLQETEHWLAVDADF